MNIGSVKQLTIGGRTFDSVEMGNLIVLYGHIATQSRITTLRKANASAGYQVTTGKTLTMVVMATMTVSAVYFGAQPLYGSTDVGIDSASAPTSPVYLAGNTTALQNAIAMGSSGATGPIYQPLDFQVPASNYPAIKGFNPLSCVVWCLES